ncbi:MAG: hypothetical protein GQ582_02430 [Methyloprofundus sp.]|nr:hypothetical protein [Methyloprofundus sp.]
MIKQLSAIFLILTLLITPVAAAFSHCTGMDMSVNQGLSAMLDSVPSQSTDKHSNQDSELDCQTTHNCSLYQCHSVAIVPNDLIISSLAKFTAINFTSRLPSKPPASSLLRPPITTLT